MRLPERVSVTEVAPRDGLQSLGRWVSTEDKVRLVERMLDAGVTSIEVTAFSHPRMVPDLADADTLLQALPRRADVDYRALVPNLRGAERALDAGATTAVALMTATSVYSMKNQGRTHPELLDQLVEVATWCRGRGLPCEAAIGLAFFDPYEAETPPDRIMAILERLTDNGVTSVYLACSTGLDSPRRVYDLCARVLDTHPDLDLGLHIHTTNGFSSATVLAGLLAGVRRFESAVCGIGGGIAMPPGMADFGNLATEDLVHLLTLLDIECGLDLPAVLRASDEIAGLLGVRSASPATRGATQEAVLGLSGAGRAEAVTR